MIGLLRQILREKGGRLGLALVLLIAAMVILGALFAGNPNQINIQARFLGPGFPHLFGTDNLGRDLFARIAWGTRTAVVISLIVVTLSLTAGLVVGITAALIGGTVDRGIIVILDIISSFPIYVLIFALVALYGTGFGKLILVISLVFLPQFARMARAQTQALMHRPFIEAERLIGLPVWKIVPRHFIPNVIGPMIVLAGMNLPVAITVEAAMSFLGLGVQPPSASLGSLIRDGYVYLDQSWWPTIGSAVVLALATLGCTLLAEATRDAVDPKLRGRV
jgi:peptide/nickel transport system permease protein